MTLTEIPHSKSGKPAMTVARDVAITAGEILIDRFRKDIDVSYKGRGNIVTDVDRAVEDAMRSILQREFPDMAFVGEESSAGRVDTGYVWVVDPLDGTRNYASGIPFFSTVVGLAFDGRVLVAVNFDPVRRDMFEAERGVGAFLNGRRITVSEKSVIADCIVGMDMSYNNEGGANSLEVVRSIWPGMQTVRIMGSAALGLSYAASGLTDLYFNHQLQPWDQVAGLLLVEEAGGVITDRNGSPAGLHSDGVIATNSTLLAEFQRKNHGMAWRRPTHLMA